MSNKPYVEIRCNKCSRGYQERLTELDYIVAQDDYTAWITMCPICLIKRVIILQTKLDVCNNQIIFVGYTSIAVKSSDGQDRNQFTESIISESLVHLQKLSASNTTDDQIEDIDGFDVESFQKQAAEIIRECLDIFPEELEPVGSSADEVSHREIAESSEVLPDEQKKENWRDQIENLGT